MAKHTSYRTPQELKASTPKPAVIAPQNPAAVVALKHFTDRVQREIQRYRGSRPNVRAQRLPRTDDFARLARRICGVSIGLVLGGGGARGISHLVSHLSLPCAKYPLIPAREFYGRWKTMVYLSTILVVSISVPSSYFLTPSISRYQYWCPYRWSIREGGRPHIQFCSGKSI